MKRYNPKDIESKWQKVWESSGLYRASDKDSRPKKYILEYFPYPSGAAMHVGHVRNYTIGDAIARFNRMRGFNVLHPMGWDAFGLPAENYAIKNNISPKVAIAENTKRFKQQLMQMGFSYDWSRELNSSDPNYYKWTQWFFLLLYRRGLAYRRESLQWWCPFDKTVLANEQVEAGRCWRCGNEVEKKALKQWFFKITDYADRLLLDLDDLNWSDSIKNMQRNWIGKSEGAEINFAVESSTDKLKVFTTRPDTLFGATFMVLSPEHPLVEKITTKEQKQHVTTYVKAAQASSDIFREKTDREKTGVFTGAYALNPLSGNKLPIWVADYVLSGYGTGAIMAVPAHDERDYEFAQKFKLPIVSVIEPKFIADTGESAVLKNQEYVKREAVVAVVRNPKTDEYLCISWKTHRMNGLVTGGIDDSEEPAAAAAREVLEETGYKNLKLISDPGVYIHSLFYHRQKQQNRWAHFRFVFFDLINEERSKVSAKEASLLKPVWIAKDKLESFFNVVEGKYLQKIIDNPLAVYSGEGVVVNSGKYDGMDSSACREQIVHDLEVAKSGKGVTNYKMRDWLISRQRYWGAPIPVVYCESDGIVPLSEDQLPLKLPEVSAIEPSGDGRSPLAAVNSFVNTKCPKCGGPAERETDTMDGFACSSWYFLRFADPHNKDAPFSKSQADYWLPVDDYIGGAEHAVMHLLYARFWTKVMKDEGLIDFSEPFMTLRNQGMILAPNGSKMSKSKGNTIEPDGLIEQGYGADSIRVMELFIGPWDQSVNWSVEGLGGTYHFLQRIWTLVSEYLDSSGGEKESEALKQIMHKTIHRVDKDLLELSFNTAVAALMECVNGLYKLKAAEGFEAVEWQWAIETLLKLLAPFAPHISEELWQAIGGEESVHIESWPEYEPNYLVDETIKIAIQVNGKIRGELSVAAGTDQAEIETKAKEELKVKAHLEGKQIIKTIYVPDKLLSLVVK